MIDFVRPVLRAAGIAASMAAAALFTFPAQAADEETSVMSVGAPRQELAAAKERARALREAAARDPMLALDTSPPYLLSIHTTGSVNAQQAAQRISVSLNAKDDLSGIAYYYIEFSSPSGTQYVSRSKEVATPLVHITPTLTVGLPPFSSPGFTAYDQPGTWRAVYFYAYDAAGNYVSYNASQLAALGSTTFNLTNNGGYDIVGPTFASGTINTPTIKRSKFAKGTTNPPYASANLSITDAGNGVVSGTSSGYLVFCHLSGGTCDDYIYMYGTTNQAGQVANTMTVGQEISATQTLGQYVIYYMYLYDVAGNYTFLESTAFGGSTNFASYFPQGATIFVNQ